MNLLKRLFKPKPKPEPIEAGRFYIHKNTPYLPSYQIFFISVVLESEDGWVVICPFSRNENKMFLDRKHVMAEYQFRKEYERVEPLNPILRNR